MTVMERYEAFCRAYNGVLAANFERLTEGLSEAEFYLADFNFHLKNAVLNSLGAWYETAREDLGGRTPQAFLEELEDAEIIPAFRYLAVHIDDELPDPFKLRLMRASETLAPQLRALAFPLPAEQGAAVTPSHTSKATAVPSGGTGAEAALQAEEADSEALIKRAALRILGEWRDAASLVAMEEGLLSWDSSGSYAAESLQAFYTAYGPAALPSLLRSATRLLKRETQAGAVGTRQPLGATRFWLDYVTIALAALGRTLRTGGAELLPASQSAEVPASASDLLDAVYACLRQNFRARPLSSKIIPVICLGDYGDGRAVTMLRRFVERDAAKMDRQLYYESVSAIQRLGGNAADLPNPYWSDFHKAEQTS